MKRLALILVLAIMVGCIGGENNEPTTTTTNTPETTAPEETDPPETPKENTSIEWLESVERAKEETNGEKLIFVDFNADSCVWCKKLEEETYVDTKVIALINEYFVPVFFDLDIASNQEVYKEKYYRYVQGSIPTILILDPNGKALYKIVGYKTGSNKTS
ncbi:MAG: DUF255 domain-containing protein, partial [Euryarchaeota archaeon]|nr:DUF255 domain-containing protein [Euryarchaeota archaeon]